MYKPNPLISVYMVLENDGEYLEKSFDSLIRQTYSNFEVIIRDNCSVDRSYEIAIEYQKKFIQKDIYFLVQRNKRKLEKPNCEKLCRRECEGEFQFFMSSNTVLAEDCFVQCIKLFVENYNLGAIVLDGDFIEEKVKIFNGEDIIQKYSELLEMKNGRIIERYIVRSKSQSRNIDFQYHSHLFKLFSDATISDIGVLKGNLVRDIVPDEMLKIDSKNYLSYVIEKYLLLMYLHDLVVDKLDEKKLAQLENATKRKLAEMCLNYSMKCCGINEDMRKKSFYMAKVFDETFVEENQM